MKNILVYVAWLMWKGWNERLFQNIFETPTQVVRSTVVYYTLNKEHYEIKQYESQLWN